MTQAVIIGVGVHPFGRYPDKSYVEIGAVAARAALHDAGIAWTDVQSAAFSRMYLPATSGARILRSLGSTRGISIFDVEAACASGGLALRQAAMSITAGEYDIVLAIGAEKMPRGFMDPTQIYEAWQVMMGLSINPSYWAMRATRHMHDYGTTEEQIAAVAVKNHRNSVHNPMAMYQKPFSMEEIMASKLVCDPIRLLEICSPNDGAAAVVLASKERARSLGIEHPIEVAACTHAVAAYSSDLRTPVDSMSARIAPPGPTVVASRQAYEHAGLGPDEIDCFEVQDTDAFCEIEAIEDLGICEPGGGGPSTESGATAIGGSTPVNMSGGLISKGEPVGASHLGQVAEIVWQLRGECGARQVSGARSGLAHVLGAGGNCSVTVLRS